MPARAVSLLIRNSNPEDTVIYMVLIEFPFKKGSLIITAPNAPRGWGKAHLAQAILPSLKGSKGSEELRVFYHSVSNPRVGFTSGMLHNIEGNQFWNPSK